MTGKRENFGSRAAVIMAMAGSAIGLGNIWRFPYLVGQNGGAAFIFIYIFFTLIISLPIFLAESAIGRRSGTNSRAAIASLIPGRAGRLLGLLTVITPLWIVSYYSVVGGWSLEYLLQACKLEFIHTSPEQLTGSFDVFIARTWAPVACHLVFLLVTVVIVALGVKGGIEKFSKICIPLLFLLIVLITVYSLSLPGASKGVEYLVKPDFSKVTGHTFLDALGQSFYSLSLGMGIILTYSSYVSRDENLLVAGAGTSICDLLFAYLAGFAIMPAVFAAGIAPGSGPGLIFDTIPYIFSQMGQQMPVLSSVAAVLFFLTILFAALTSSISLVEVGVAYLTETLKISRAKACFWLFLLCGGLGVLASLSFGPLSGVKLFNLSLFDFADSFASNVLLVAGGVLSVILAGWVMPKKEVFAELTNRGTKPLNVKLFPVVYFLLRYVAPLGIGAMIISLVL
ncbi:MAG: sodium-dependent transporter [Bacteroidales bacterium]|nr:sodium-dependent transporter [Bacteroidales bacterium]